jgi:hypothetical protein
MLRTRGGQWLKNLTLAAGIVLLCVATVLGMFLLLISLPGGPGNPQQPINWFQVFLMFPHNVALGIFVLGLLVTLLGFIEKRDEEQKS